MQAADPVQAAGLFLNGDSRDAMEVARLIANLHQEQAPREAEPQVVSLADRASVEVKKSELAARVMMFSLRSGNSVSDCKSLDVTDAQAAAQLERMASDATRLQVLTVN